MLMVVCLQVKPALSETQQRRCSRGMWRYIHVSVICLRLCRPSTAVQQITVFITTRNHGMLPPARLSAESGRRRRRRTRLLYSWSVWRKWCLVFRRRASATCRSVTAQGRSSTAACAQMRSPASTAASGLRRLRCKWPPPSVDICTHMRTH